MNQAAEESPITVVIVTYNSARFVPGIARWLPAALAGLDQPQVVVVDNNSGDETESLVRSLLPLARWLRLDRNAGYAAAINAAIAAHPPGRAAVVLNPDIELRPGALKKLVHALDRDGAGIAVPRLVRLDGSLEPSLRREPTLLRAAGETLLGGRLAGRWAALGEMVPSGPAYGRPGAVDWASGAAMAISRRCLDAVGAWDESFFLYSEETDFALRARDAGFLVRFVPDAEGVHLGGEAHTSPQLWSLLMLNRARLYARRHGRVSAALYRACLAAGEGLRLAARRNPAHGMALRVLLRGALVR